MQLSFFFFFYKALPLSSVRKLEYEKLFTTKKKKIEESQRNRGQKSFFA